MKKSTFLLSIAFLISTYTFSIQPFYSLGSVSSDMKTAVSEIKSKITNKGYEVIGEYKPGNNNNLFVIAFTNTSLKKLASSFKDRGYLAATMKVSLIKKDSKIFVSIVNPEYIFNAYFGENLENSSLDASVTKLANKILEDVKTLGNTFSAFGGEVEKDDLREYHYMLGMPYFSDPIELKEFSSFEEGIKTIQKNLSAKKNNSIKVYELIDSEKKVAVFGVGLLNGEDGESHFLPIIGEDHVAAMPYEIIIQGNEATMLHGRFRFALYWPELTMGTFTKIMSTPGYVEDVLESLTE